MDKRTTEREAVAELRDGMTIGIGGWGSRRKPMSIVREILRSSVKDLTVVTYGGPDVGLLCNAGKIKKLDLRLRLPRLDRARAAFPQGPPGRRDRSRRTRRRHAAVGAARGLAQAALPAHARGPRLGRAGRSIPTSSS